jgi:hypothetical protein
MTQPIVADLVARLDANLREAYEERAGIMEFDAGLPREHAECLALINVLGTHPLALTGLTALRARRGEATQYVLTTDRDRARAWLISAGFTVAALSDLTAVLAKFGGMAVLSRVG